MISQFFAQHSMHGYGYFIATSFVVTFVGFGLLSWQLSRLKRKALLQRQLAQSS